MTTMKQTRKMKSRKRVVRKMKTEPKHKCLVEGCQFECWTTALMRVHLKNYHHMTAKEANHHV